MAPSSKTRKLFIEIPSDLDVDLDGSEQQAAVLGRRFALPRARWPLVVAGGLAAALLVVGSVACRRPRQPPPEAAAALDGSGLQAAYAVARQFQQCGGTGWDGPTCCATGCACVATAPTYSQCKPANGSQQCDSEAAQSQAMRAVEEASKLKKALKQQEAGAIFSEEKAKEAKALAEKAKAAKEQAEKAPERTVRRTAEAKLREAKAAATKAAREADGKDANIKAAADELKLLDQTNTMQANRSCAAVYGQCGGPKLAPNIACCMAGCICKKKNEYFSQCEAVGNSGRCDPAAAASRAVALRAQLGRLKQELTPAAAAKAAAEQALEAAAGEAARARETATPADAAFARAAEAAEEEVARAGKAAEEASRGRRQAEASQQELRRWTRAAIEWRMAAAGCGPEGAHAADWARQRIAAASAAAESEAAGPGEAEELRFLRGPSKAELDAMAEG